MATARNATKAKEAARNTSVTRAKKASGKATSRAARAEVVTTDSEEYKELIFDHRENSRKLARSLLRRWRVRLTPDEIDSVVDLALCEAASRYSAEKGASFMTFMFYHLRGQLVRTISSAANSNNIFAAFARNIGMEVGDWDTVDEDTLLGFVPDQVVFGNKEVEGPESKYLKEEQKTLTNAACGKLDELEQEVIRRSYENEESLVDIAKDLGYSRCHISRVKKRALDQLRAHLDPTGEEGKGLGQRREKASRPTRTRRRRGGRRTLRARGSERQAA